MSIGEVLAQVRDDFPDVTISKIRFLEAEGLLRPERTAAGYRKFSREHVARLRYVLTAQRDRYLPLRVIREHLEEVDRGESVLPDWAYPGGRPIAAEPPAPPAPATAAAEPPAPPAPSPPPAQPDPRSDRTDPGRSGARSTGADRNTRHSAASTPAAPEPTRSRVSRADVCRESGLSDRQLRELEQYGLLSGGAGGTYFDADVLPIAALVADLSRFGLQARHLRAFKAAADREVGLLEQVAAPMARQRDPEARARSAEDVRELVSLSLRLHVALVKAGLRSSAHSRGQDSAP